MNIVFLGTPEFSVPSLKRIYELPFVKVLTVVCNRDKPFGRKKILTPPPVKVFAESQGIPVLQYDKIRTEGAIDLKKLNPDIMITCAFGQILSQEILDIPKLGVYNIHASLLPKYRGASPIHYAILCGEKETGVTIMKTDIGIDTGDVLLQRSIPIEDGETCGELFARLSVLGAECIEEALYAINSGKFELTKQNDGYASYTKIIRKEDALIDWNDSAENIVNKIRAFNPSPVAFTYLKGEIFKVYRAEICDLKGNIGEAVFKDGKLVIGCKNGSVSLTEVCKAGGKKMPIKEFLLGNRIFEGEKFGV